MRHNLNIPIKNEKLDSKLLSQIIYDEFSTSCEKILILSQSKFINDFFKKISLSLQNYYSFNINPESKEFNRLLFKNKINFITNIYTPMFKLCSSAIEQYNTKNTTDNINISYLINYKPHCMLYNNNNNSIGKHICGGKYIIISKNSKKNETNNFYIICTKCNKCYLDICFPIICCNCNTLYYSEIIDNKIKTENCYLATWFKYHCKNINNEKMTCIKCGNNFWIKNNKLLCIKCKFEIEPINIIWTCLICNTDFNSEAKVYNKYEFKLAELILKEALIYKKITKPYELPCKCFQKNNMEIKEIDFFHKYKNIKNNECKGFLYYCEINDMKYLVCSKCFNIYSINKYKWTCPICFKLFYSSKIIILKSHLNKKKNIKKYNSYFTKNNSLKSIKLNPRIFTKKTSPKKERIISILSSDENIKNKPQNKMHRISSFYSPTISLIKDNRYFTNNNSGTKIKKGRNKINTNINNIIYESNLCLYDTKNKKINLSVLPGNFRNNDECLTIFQKDKNNNKLIRSTTSTVFNNKIFDSNDNDNKYFYYQNRNNIDIKDNEVLIFGKKLNSLNSGFKCKNIQNNDINNKDSCNKKNLSKNKKLNKSFNLVGNKNLQLNQDIIQKNTRKENSINELSKIDISKSHNISTINNSLLGSKNKIYNKSINKIKHHRKIRNIISIQKNNFLNLSTSDKKLIEYTQNKNSIKINFFNNITINNLTKSNISITNNNSKKKRNKSLERIKNFKIKNKIKKLKEFNIDDYTIITQLGQGSYGKIYLVKDSNKNIYSIKKILLSEELDVKSVIDEYNMCYNFSHPNIINIMGIYSKQLDRTTYVVYVLMEVGISDWDKEINSLKVKNSHYTEKELFNILKQIVSACSFLQKNNISHRDIKPQNILVFKNNIYKLIDFGEARRIRDKEKNNKSLIQYSLKGTELYMSPLLFNGLRSGQIDVNHNVYKSDVYSLGLCMLYAAKCTDKVLFEIRRIISMEKLKNYINSALKDNYSEILINIIISMLEIHEQKRPDFIELEHLINKEI